MEQTEQTKTGPLTNLWLALGVVLVLLLDAVNDGPLLVAVILLAVSIAAAAQRVLNKNNA